MQVAYYARVSTHQQQQEGTIESQRRSLKHSIQHHGWFLLPEHEYIDDGISGARLDRPALDRLRDAARRGEFDAVVILSPDRLARNYAHQWLLIEEFEKLHTQVIFLHNPFGDTPQGKLLTQMQGMIAEYERAQITERTRRGRLEKARRGEFMPWAYCCYGYRYLPRRHGGTPQVMIEPLEAEVVRTIYRVLVEEQLSCRQITKRLNAAKTPTPTGKNQVWQTATVRNILTNRTYAGQARYNYRRPVIPRYRKTEEHQLRSLKTGRSYRAESEWIWSEAPAIITRELFEKAQWQLQRNAEAAQKRYQPASGRYLLRTLVKCGACGLGMVGMRQLSTCKKYHYLYYQCTGHAPLTVGRTTRCSAKLVRAERLDTVVWNALSQLLRNPSMIPHLHQTWVEAKQQDLSGLEAQQAQLVQRRQRLERQDQRLLDAYQAEIMTLHELQPRRQKLTAALQQIEQESQQLAQTRQQSVHWQQVIDNAATFRQLLGDNLAQLSFEEQQAITRCLISKVVVTGEEVDIHFILPFDSTPQVAQRLPTEPEGTPGHFYRLRLAHFEMPFVPGLGASTLELIGIVLSKFPTPLADGFMGDVDAALEQEFLHVAVAQSLSEKSDSGCQTPHHQLNHGNPYPRFGGLGQGLKVFTQPA
jgi:site-specific DNA recombinase